MGLDNKMILNALNASAKELQQSLDLHCCLVAGFLEGRTEDGNCPPLLERCPKLSRTLELKKALKEAIEVLEESRKAFKSKQLEALRKKLTRVLIDAG